ncbi:hypothetical protein [uncultured Psychroserpens sp.]|uniref:hypothetical protein n=1 Tax=uncultured Psychroserpens sp. TaxID=255436 RepID=UPI002629E594|nr:hypothetical protein [uncultured Psychroserpens sp.]
MKTVLRLFMLSVIISFSSCQKDEITVEEEKSIKDTQESVVSERRGASTCDAVAGTLTADTSLTCLDDGLILSASSNGDENVPGGFEIVYGLTRVEGSDLVIDQFNDSPDFVVDESGSYAIHSLVYNPSDFSLSIVVLGTTTVSDVEAFFNAVAFCTSFDPVGAQTIVVDCAQPCGAFAGTLTADDANPCIEGGLGEISATSDGNTIVPDGYSLIYGLVDVSTGIVLDMNATPDFSVTEPGTYSIHGFVYRTGSKYITYIQYGVTRVKIVLGYIESHPGTICASIDLDGATFNVTSCID